MSDFYGGFLFFSSECVLLLGCGFFITWLLQRSKKRRGWLLLVGGLLASKQFLAFLWLFIFFKGLSSAAFVAGAVVALTAFLGGVCVYSVLTAEALPADSTFCLRPLRLRGRSSRLQRNMGITPRMQYMQVVK